MSVNRQQLAKILELMRSTHDGEALAAARRADALVKASGMDWAHLLGATAPAAPLDPLPPRPEPTSRRRGREITSYEMLMALLQSERTPAPVKKRLRPLERALLDGDVDETVLVELRQQFMLYVAAASAL
jgi:hypothetical protein